MQTPAEIFAQVRGLIWVDENQYSDTEMLNDFNSLNQEIQSDIVNSGTTLKWQRWTVSSTALQSEYTMQEIAEDASWTRQLDWVSINYNWETYEETGELIYIKADRVDLEGLQYDFSYYQENQSEDKPIYYVADNSYFIAPTPRTTVTNWLRLRGMRTVPDVALDSTDLGMTQNYISALSFWLMPYGLMRKRAEESVIQAAEVRWEKKKQRVIDAIKNRVKETPFFNNYSTDNAWFSVKGRSGTY